MCALPLAIDVEHTETVGKARRDFAVEEAHPLRIRDGLVVRMPDGVRIGMCAGRQIWTKFKVEMRIDPVIGVGRVRRITGERGGGL